MQTRHLNGFFTVKSEVHFVDSFEKNASSKHARMMGSPHENGRTVPLVQDSKGRRVKDRLQNIDTAMAWIKEELVSAERRGGRGRGMI